MTEMFFVQGFRQKGKKLEPDPSNPRYLVTEPWVGYRFNPKG